MTLEQLREKAALCPQLPGVYRMFDRNDVVIYVGKAKNLKNRVSQYFHNIDAQWIKTQRLVAQIDRFETIVTKTELEALVLENTLIKRYAPRYNILLKDDKGYPFVRYDPKEDYPRFSLVNNADPDARCYGPYGGRTVAHDVIDILTDTFKLPNCSRKFPREIGRTRPCLRKELGRCIGVCTGDVTPEAYHALLDEASLLLNGRCDDLLKSLGERMEEASENLDFERAAYLRDRLRAVERLAGRQKVVAAHVPDADIICLYNAVSRACVVVLHYVDGTLLDKDQVILPACESDEDCGETLSQFVAQYYKDRPILPREVLLSHETPDADLLSEYLTERAGRRVYVLFPQRGEKRVLLDMAMDNAREEARIAAMKEERAGYALTLLQKALGLPIPPERLEAYDISHTEGRDAVGGMVVFMSGKPRRSAYRKFKIEDGVGGDDYASMRQVLTRRLMRAQDGDKKFLPLPEVFLIDGGMEHAKLAREVLDAYGVRVPAVGMVKDERHRTRALISPDGLEIGIRTQPALYALIGTIDEEVHRYALSYHRTLRDKKLRASALDAVPGVGEKRKATLLKKFGSLKAIRTATLAELEAVIPKNAAAAVYQTFRKNADKPEMNENRE
ncbi:MAG: excinuclease ABC subunit UvrC [Clostridiales bacterium]|nr:excinuclease ABC subunit UvrC [Clostridiales bacterium]